MPERMQWTDAALDREFDRLVRQINGTPARMARVEEAVKTLGNVQQDTKEEHETDMREIKAELVAIRKELKGSEWSRSQIIGAWGVVVSFCGVAVAVAAVIFA